MNEHTTALHSSELSDHHLQLIDAHYDYPDVALKGLLGDPASRRYLLEELELMAKDANTYPNVRELLRLLASFGITEAIDILSKN